jgi:hypothetical protein
MPSQERIGFGKTLPSFVVSLVIILSPIARANPIGCGALLSQKSPHTVGPQLAIMNAVADRYFQKIGSEMNPVSRAAFYRQVRAMKPSDSATAFGAAKNLFHQLKLNPLLIDHPLIRITAVHESQHLADFGPLTPSIISVIRDSMDTNSVEKTESRAFGREYDYMKELLKTPGFNAEAALAEYGREPLPQHELEKAIQGKYKLDDPVLDDWGEPSPEFRANPEKFFRDEGARAILANFFIGEANSTFIYRIESAKEKTKEQYINDRIKDYDQQINRHKRIAYATWAMSGLMVTSCSFMGYLLSLGTTAVGN